ncbi:MAG: CAP domain-containing protein [Micromonosporaceae bacterium]
MFVRTTATGRRLFPWLITIALTATLFGTLTHASADSYDPVECLNDREAEFLELINDFRDDHDVRRLEAVEDLNQAAYDHSRDMARNGFFDHDNPDGDEPADRMDSRGYNTRGYTGENIAAGYSSAKAVFDVWRDSPDHRSNMLDEDFRVIGIGRYHRDNSEYGTYWTTDFGSRSNTEPDC